MMTKADYLALAEARYDALTKLHQQPDFYSFEQQFDQIWTDLGRDVLEKTIGPVPNDHRKKTSFGADTESCK